MATTHLDAALDAALGHEPTAPTASGTPAMRAGQQLARVALADLHPDPNNPRDEVTDVAELAASIEQVGLLQPIIVRREPVPGGERLVVVCGHRRLAALQHLAWPDVDVIVRREMRSDEVLVAMIAENQQRVLLDPIEEARAFNRLRVVEHLNHLQISERVGRTQSYVSGRLALLSLNPQEQEEIRAGHMTLAHGTRMGRVKSGAVRNRAKGAGWHLSSTHPLSARARARCLKLEHPRGTRLGGVACGQCWEQVIRANERTSLHDSSARSGECVLCGTQNAGVRAAPGAPVATHEHVATEATSS